METSVRFLAASFFLLNNVALADIVFDNEYIDTNAVFDLKFALDSYVSEAIRNQTKYYCVFRSLWTSEDHPVDYPELARFSPPVIFSHTKQYTPFINNREANYGLEILAEEGFTSKFQDQIDQAGNYILDYQEGAGFYLNQKFTNLNFEYLPPVKVTQSWPYISAMTGFDPSPDWFTGFYLMNTIDEYSREFWEHFKIQTYPWDAGTDAGTTYSSIDYEMEFPDKVQRFSIDSTPDGIFVSPLGDRIMPVAEWECLLHICPEEDDDCEKPDWPPENGCDILRYPECNSICDPKVDSPCERCRRISALEPQEVYYVDCCAAGREPKVGLTCAQKAVSGGIAVAASWWSLVMMAVVATFLVFL